LVLHIYEAIWEKEASMLSQDEEEDWMNISKS